MVITAIVIFGYGNFCAGIIGVDLVLYTLDDEDRAAEILGYPRTFIIGGIPKTAGALHNGLDLLVGERSRGHVAGSRVPDIDFRVPVEIIYIEQSLAGLVGSIFHRLQIFIRKPIA